MALNPDQQQEPSPAILSLPVKVQYPEDYPAHLKHTVHREDPLTDLNKGQLLLNDGMPKILHYMKMHKILEEGESCLASDYIRHRPGPVYPVADFWEKITLWLDKLARLICPIFEVLKRFVQLVFRAFYHGLPTYEPQEQGEHFLRKKDKMATYDIMRYNKGHIYGGRTDLIPNVVPGDGSCLFHALSMCSDGHIRRNKELRVRMILELCFNWDYYQTHPFHFGQYMVGHGSFIETLDLSLFMSRSWANAFHISALATQMQMSINLTQVGGEEGARYLHRSFQPAHGEPVRAIDVAFVNCRPKTAQKEMLKSYERNHFVPLLRRRQQSPVEQQAPKAEPLVLLEDVKDALGVVASLEEGADFSYMNSIVEARTRELGEAVPQKEKNVSTEGTQGCGDEKTPSNSAEESTEEEKSSEDDVSTATVLTTRPLKRAAPETEMDTGSIGPPEIKRGE